MAISRSVAVPFLKLACDSLTFFPAKAHLESRTLCRLVRLGFWEGLGFGMGGRTAVSKAVSHLLDDRLLALRRFAALDVGMRFLDDLACEGTQREIRTSSE